MTARRWGSNFLGPYDGGYNGIAKREFKTHAIRAEFWHDAIEQELQGLRGARSSTAPPTRSGSCGRAASTT